MKKVVLIILDGWGIAKPAPGNALSQAYLPAIKDIENYYPATMLHASGINVGLPWWEGGNSEVGHLTLGSGRVIYQYLPRIITAIQNGSFFQNPAFLGAIKQAKEKESSLHLIGLTSSGAIHSYIDHLYALLDLCKKEGLNKVFLHVFTDGRDSSQKEAITFLQNLAQRLEIQNLGKIATIAGRSYAMDRDRNWDRIKKVYNCLTEGKGIKIERINSYLKNSYEKEITDEYIEPAIIEREGIIKENDAVIFFNFREDRARELTRAFVEDDFKGFKRKKINNLYFGTMTRYLDSANIKVAFEPPTIKNTLGGIISKANLYQLRIAETEKYAHVTYFFNGLLEKPFKGEDREIIASEGGPHYDRNPEMQAPAITEKLITEIKKNKYHFILVNFANPDMIGHTANLKAAIKAAEVLDKYLRRIIEAAEGKYIVMITADHGNLEEMINPRTGEVDTEHSVNPVPFYLIDKDLKSPFPKREKLDSEKEAGGFLFDVAPTVLKYLSLPKPEEMIGSSLTQSLSLPR